MPAFKHTPGQVLLWEGDPDCDAAHGDLLHRLNRMGTNFLRPNDVLSVRQKGNLGEFASLHVALLTTLQPFMNFADNATNPLQNISSAGIDIIYAYFDANNPAHDKLYIQETKTTGNPNMVYANKLVDDYKKLFGDDIDFTLHSRLQVLANKLEFSLQQPQLVNRVLQMGATTPQTCNNIYLLPTAVHEKNGSQPIQRMLAIKTSIAAFGWSAAAIWPWAISISDLDARLQRLARGLP